MATSRFKRGFLWLLKHSVNRVATRMAATGRGPFSLVRHVGRKTGRVYETPLILAQVPGGFVAELTYGQDVAWYRNTVAAGGCTLIVNGQAHRIDAIEPYPTEAGLRAFGHARGIILKTLRRREFRFLRETTE